MLPRRAASGALPWGKPCFPHVPPSRCAASPPFRGAPARFPTPPPARVTRGRLHDRSRPRLDRVLGGDPIAERATEALPLLGRPGAEREQAVGERPRVLPPEAELVRQERVERRVRRNRRRAARARLVHHLVGRARAHVVDQHVRTCEQPRHLAAQHRVAELHPAREVELLDQPLELAAMRPFLRVQRRPVGLQPQIQPVVEREPDSLQRDVEALGPRVAPEDEHTQIGVRRLAVPAGELGEVDPVPDPAHLRRVDRECAPVDAEHGVRDPLGQPQRP